MMGFLVGCFYDRVGFIYNINGVWRGGKNLKLGGDEGRVVMGGVGEGWVIWLIYVIWNF